MTTGLLALNKAERMLAEAETPEETRKVEALTAGIMESAKALRDEQESYETYMKAWRVYIFSIRKTTELLTAGNMQVTYGDYGWNKQEWHRRMKLLNMEVAQIDTYFDDVIAKGGQPAKNHLYMIADGKEPSPQNYVSREQRILDELADEEQFGDSLFGDVKMWYGDVSGKRVWGITTRNGDFDGATILEALQRAKKSVQDA